VTGGPPPPSGFGETGLVDAEGGAVTTGFETAGAGGGTTGFETGGGGGAVTTGFETGSGGGAVTVGLEFGGVLLVAGGPPSPDGFGETGCDAGGLLRVAAVVDGGVLSAAGFGGETG
jgi:hypothetical protein